MNTTRFQRFAAFATLATVLWGLPGCGRSLYDPALATRSYPAELHRAESVDVQVFRDGQTLELVNATARSYSDFDLWINQRYVRRVLRLVPRYTSHFPSAAAASAD